MFRKILFSIFMIAAYFISICSYGQEKTSTTTTVQETTTQVKPVRRSYRKVRPAPKPAEVTTSTISTSTTTEAEPPKMVARKVYDSETLKKISNTICTEGFKAYIGTDKKNVCLNKASPPDLAYTCVWDKKGTPAYAPTPQGPCSLDFVEHKGSVTIKKDTFPHDAPLSYGVEAQCCFRAAQGPATTSTR